VPSATRLSNSLVASISCFVMRLLNNSITLELYRSARLAQTKRYCDYSHAGRHA
jgi:hypothetical protein